MNAKTTTIAKKLIRKVPNRAIEAAAALVIGKAFKGNRRATGIVTGIGVVALAHYVIEWASKDS